MRANTKIGDVFSVKIDNYTYGQRTVTENKNGRNTVTTFDGWGNVVQATDRMGYTVNFNYHSSGQPKQITAAGATFSMEYDNAGNQTKLTDPNAGTIQYTKYDGFGRVREQKDANNKTQTVAYNAWGELSESKLGAVITAYAYNSKGWMTGVSEAGGHTIDYMYDNYGRPVKETLVIAGEGNFETSYTYNTANGNIASITYPGGIIETRTYDANGNPDEVKAGSAVVWKLNSVTATQTEAKLAGNAMTATATYTAKGLLNGLKTDMGSSNILRNYTYSFNSGNGNLKSRSFSNKTANSSYTETFAYDSLYRLTTVTGANAMTINYGSGSDNAKGNIYSTTRLGVYTYGSKPHAVTSVATNPGYVLQQNITYTDFNKAKSISQGDHLLNIDYGPDRQRVKSVLKKNNSIIKTVIFAGNYERIS